MADEPIPSANPTETSTPTTKPLETPDATALGAGLAAAPSKDPNASPSDVGDKPVVPEKYADWKLPDGYQLDTGVSEAGSKIFKELNLTQDQAQKLVDFYSEHAIKTSKELMDGWSATRNEWREGIKNDPELGKLVGSDGNFGPDSQLVQTVNRALQGLQNPKLVSDFKDAMDLTGAGDNPAFVRVLYALASKVTEGTTYPRGEPPRVERPRSAGAALYPNLPSGA